MDLNQVTLPAVDLQRSIAFYRALGLRLIVESVNYARFELPSGTSTLSLSVVEQLATDGAGVHVYFECSDLGTRVDTLKASGIAFDNDPIDQPWLWREAWLRDPAGNHLCLFRAGVNRRNPPWRLEGA